MGSRVFVCGFRFWANFFAVLRFWTIFSSVLRFLIHTNVPLLNEREQRVFFSFTVDWAHVKCGV